MTFENDLEYVYYEYSDGDWWIVDRRVTEVQPDGEVIIRDPITCEAWKTDGTKLPIGWRWGEQQ